MFPKIDKKILIILIIVLVIFLFAGYFVFKYTRDIRTRAEDSIGGANTEQQEQQGNKEPSLDEENYSVEIEYPRVKTEPQSGLFICVDQCGDKICQTSDAECKDDLNCICAETKTDCPSDCQ